MRWLRTLWMVVVWILPGPVLAGPYAEWSLDSGVSGTGTFGGEAGMPGFNFALSGDLTPADTEIDDDDLFDEAGWEALFGDADDRDSLRFRSPGTTLTISTLTITFDAPTNPTQPWGFAVTDLEGEDATLTASLGGVPIDDAVVAGWFQGLFDSQPGTDGSPHLPSAFDAAAVAVVAEFDPDGVLSDEELPATGTESASAWFLPDTPIDTLTIAHRNRFGGAASMHVYLAVAPEPSACAPAPVAGCLEAAKAKLSIQENKPGNEKLKAKLGNFDGVTSQADFGDPVSGSTGYQICLYDGAPQLVGELGVDRAGQTCGPKQKPCWKAKGTKGFTYKDPLAAADGVKKLVTASGPIGKGKVKAQAGNKTRKGQTSLPTGIAAALQNATSATLQVLASDGLCFEGNLDTVKKADGTQFKAKAP